MRNLHLLRNINSQKSALSDFSKCFILSEPTTDGIQMFIFSKCLKVYSDNGLLLADLSNFVNISDHVVVVGCNYIFSELFIFLNTGYLITINIESGTNEVQVKQLNFVNIVNVVWSPDFERTVLIRENGFLSVLSVLNDDWDNLQEISLMDCTEEQNKFVNVGWGSVETQFRGSEGKFSNIKPTEFATKENIADTSVHICWKQNSTAFAVSYLCLNEKIRKIKIFNQDGLLLNITTDIYGLQPVIDWWPSRNLITSVQMLPNKKIVCFLEENGLRHGEFRVADNINITELHWNNTGSILAIQGTENEHPVITLWTSSNYKWFQKQKLEFKQHVMYMQWDLEVPHRLHIILEHGIYRIFEWLFQISESVQCDYNHNLSIIAVINDKIINLTPYKFVCLPPSIPHSSYSTETAINVVIFGSSSETNASMNPNSAILYLSNNHCLLMTHESCKMEEYSFRFEDTDEEIEFSTPLELSVWLWLQPYSLYFQWSRSDGNYFCVSSLEPVTKSIIIQKIMKLDSLIIAIINYNNDVIVHTEDGFLLIYQNDELRPMNITLLEPCFRLQVLNSNTLLGLSKNRNLYINSNIKWRDIVSFYWRSPFLVVLTMNSQLFITKVDFKKKEAEFNEVLARSVEPKCNLITIVDDQILLEMDRGNLEVVTPRPFSIYKMEKMLLEGQYFEVFRMLRKQRINLNVIFDHDPDAFFKNVRYIVNSITDPMYLSTFITELENDNVARKMFPWKYDALNGDVPNKVHSICEALVNCIRESNTLNLTSPLIAALIRQHKLTEAAHEAFKHNEIATLCHLVDPLEVYKAALTSYDLPCALKIVEHSKLDPSEYLLFIHELQQTEENYRKFKICNYLGKTDKALEHLIECTEGESLDECIAYIEKHVLYRNALKVFMEKFEQGQSIDHKFLKILTVVAEHFYQTGVYGHAALLFEKIGQTEQALNCFINNGDWFSAISIIKNMNSDVSKTEIYNKIYNVLRNKGQNEDAGFIAYNFLEDSAKAVNCYLTAKKYCKAINSAKGLSTNKLIEKMIRPHLQDEAKTMLDSMILEVSNVELYVKRLDQLRKMNKTEYFDDDKLSCVSLDSSDSGSLSSFGSRASSVSTSSKRARRLERKLWNLKEGNPREEPSLLKTIRDTIQNSAKEYSITVPDLCTGLIRVDDWTLAQKLWNEYDRVKAYFTEIKCKVWPSNELTEEGGFTDIQIRCPPDIVVASNSPLLCTN